MSRCLSDLPADVLERIARLDPVPHVATMALRSVNRATLAKLGVATRPPRWLHPPYCKLRLTVDNRSGRVRVSYRCIKHGLRPRSTVHELLLSERPEQLRWVLAQGPAVSPEDLYSAIKSGSIEAFELLWQHRSAATTETPPFSTTETPHYHHYSCAGLEDSLVYNAACYGRLPLVRKMVEDLGFPDRVGHAMPRILEDDNTVLLDWHFGRHQVAGRLPPCWVERRPHRGSGDLDDICDMRVIATTAIEEDRLPLLQWVCRRGGGGLLDRRLLDVAVGRNGPDVMAWLRASSLL